MRAPPDRVFGQSRLPLVIGALISIAMLFLGACPVAAQSRASQKASPAGSATKKPSSTKAAIAPDVRRNPLSPVREKQAADELLADPTFANVAARPFLTGDEWQDTRLRFEQWLSIQTLYDADQVERMRSKFAERANAISSADRKQFVNDMDAKLQILYGPRALALQDYFAKSLSVATPAYVKKARQPLPDVVRSTPGQLKERLAHMALRHQASVEVHQAFEQARQMRIATDDERGNARREQVQPPGHLASASTATNRQPKNGYKLARDYFPPSGHSITYSVIPAMPMMTNGGWAMFGGGVAITMQRDR